MCRSTLGIAPHFAIDSVVRAVGRIVVCVEAAAEVRTATIRNFTPTEPSTPLPERVEHVGCVFFVGDEAGAVVGLRAG